MEVIVKYVLFVSSFHQCIVHPSILVFIVYFRFSPSIVICLKERFFVRLHGRPIGLPS